MSFAKGQRVKKSDLRISKVQAAGIEKRFQKKLSHLMETSRIARSIVHGNFDESKHPRKGGKFAKKLGVGAVTKGRDGIIVKRGIGTGEFAFTAEHPSHGRGPGAIRNLAQTATHGATRRQARQRLRSKLKFRT